MSVRDEELEVCSPNLYLEKLLQLRATRPKDWAVLSPSAKLSALAYESQRRKAMEREAMPDEGAEAA